jgi:hypothetical protein
MTTDKVFILLLVILFPLSGCLDVTDTAEAEESEEETTIINNYYNYYYNNTTTTQSVEMPDIVSHHIQENQTLNLSFDGTFTYQLESTHRHYCSTSPFQPTCSWAQSSMYYTQVNCDGGLLMENISIGIGQFLPVLPNESCNFSMTATQGWEWVMVFSIHTLG